MKKCLAKIHHNETGAAIAETAITIPTFLIVILGIIQLTLVINAKLLVNYAAYCAARAGIVHNGDLNKMNQAAAVALTPLFTGSKNPFSSGGGYLQALASPALRVEILSPSSQRFEAGYQKRFFPTLKRYGEIENDKVWLDENLLVVKITLDYPLQIPLINQMLRPFLRRIPISSLHRMRMQSDAITKGGS